MSQNRVCRIATDRGTTGGAIVTGQITIRNSKTGEVIVSFPDDTHEVCARPCSLHIEGRRWFRRGPGGTYHTARIFLDGHHVHTTSIQGGSGDQFLQSAAAWLGRNGFPQLIDVPFGTRMLREDLGGTYSVVDVSRERDL
jgi:hypothetical protein